MPIPATQRDPARQPAAQPPQADWQTVLADAVRDPVKLCRLLHLPPQWEGGGGESAAAFPVLVPRPYLARIRPGDPCDPLLAQVLPRQEEMTEVPGFVADPLAESAAVCGPGLLRKYRHRLLILSSDRCGVHCRFCFRRHERPGRVGWDEGRVPPYAATAADQSLHEVILSGGDPLALPDSQLTQIAAQLAEIGHLRRLRIHTRMPIVIPQRVTDELLGWLRGTRLTAILVVHVNHPAEIDDAVAAALGRLVDAGVPVLSQSVLLRGVNDDVEALAELFTRLVDLRVMPYYLHQLDRVAGAAHFEVPVERGLQLLGQLRARLPGYAVPRYVRDTPSRPNKEVLA